MSLVRLETWGGGGGGGGGLATCKLDKFQTLTAVLSEQVPGPAHCLLPNKTIGQVYVTGTVGDLGGGGG